MHPGNVQLRMPLRTAVALSYARSPSLAAMLAWYASVSASEKRPTAASAASCSHQALLQTHNNSQICTYERHSQHSQELHHRIHVRISAARQCFALGARPGRPRLSPTLTHHKAHMQPMLRRRNLCVSSEHASAGAVHAAACLLIARFLIFHTRFDLQTGLGKDRWR